MSGEEGMQQVLRFIPATWRVGCFPFDDFVGGHSLPDSSAASLLALQEESMAFGLRLRDIKAFSSSQSTELACKSSSSLLLCSISALSVSLWSDIVEDVELLDNSITEGCFFLRSALAMLHLGGLVAQVLF